MDVDVLAIAAVAITVVLFVLLSYLGRKKNVDFGILTILALVFGIVIGIVFKGHVELTAVFGRIYTNLISALVIPLLFVSIISSISSLDNISKLKTIGFKSIFWLVANTFTASLLTLIIAGSLKVGQSINFTLPTDYEPKEVPSFLDTIVGLFLKNVVSHAANGEIVPFIVFTIMVGVALVYLQEREKEAAVPFKNFIDSANKLMFVVVEFVVDLTPFAVLSLIANAVSTYGAKELIPLLGVLVLSYVLCAIQMFLIDGALIRFAGGLSPIRFFRGFWPTLLAVLAINIFDIPYSIGQYAFLIVLTLIVSIGTVGVPGTSTVTTTALFTAAGLPVEIIVLLVPISSVVDMMRTAANVTGAATAAVLVAKSEQLLDREVYDQGKSEEGLSGAVAVGESAR